MVVFTDFSKGRLGNQLFFVASTIGIAIKNKTTYEFTSQMGHSGINYQGMFKNSLPIVDIIPQKKLHQEKFSYYDVVLDNNDDVEIMGYFQSEKFFSHCEPLIRSQFEFKDELVSEVINKYPTIKDSLSIHIRRGDYVNQPNHHPVSPISYYENILNTIGDNYNNIFVFSDDIEWVKEKFIGEKYVFPSFENDCDTMSFILMSCAKDNVICNSTYSWWAAWLNKNETKKVYSPTHKEWFGLSYNNLDTKDLIPDNWIKIEY